MLDGLREAESLREARAEDRARLHRFTCTNPSTKHYTPGAGKSHPKPWEMDVQTYLRGRTPPLRRPDEKMLVVVGEDEIRAACHYGFYEGGEAWLIQAIASALAVQGEGYGSYMLGAVIELCERDVPDLPIMARIDVRNEPSERLFGSQGFVPTGFRVESEPLVQIWAREARQL